MLMMLALQSPGLLQLAATARAADADYVLMLMMLAERLMLMMLALHSFAFLQLAATDRTADADDARPGRHYTRSWQQHPERLMLMMLALGGWLHICSSLQRPREADADDASRCSPWAGWLHICSLQHIQSG